MIILNVDDDLEDREIFLGAVKEISPSIVCITASNGIEAQSLWGNDPNFPRLDFIFLDINMPKMDGIALLEVMKKDNRFDDVPVYMLSTTSNKNEISNITSLGATFMAKQNRYADIVSGLRSIIYPTGDLIEVVGKR